MKARSILLMFALGTLGASAAAQEPQREPETIREPAAQFPETAPPHEVLIHPHRQQRDKYVWGTFGPPGLMEAAASAGLDQWLNTPKEWGEGTAGYYKRFASGYGESAINATTRYVLARLSDEDPTFHPCDCSGFRRRALHAIVSPFVAYDFDDGRAQFSLARVAGTAAASAVSVSVWKPKTLRAGDEAAHLTFSILSAMGVNLLREFVFHHR